MNDWVGCKLKKCPYGKEYGNCDTCINLIRKENDVHEQIVSNRWIPVSERLPEEDGCYMVTMKIPFYEAGAYGYITGTAYYISCAIKWYDANGEVIAWMPLPEPYKEAENEQDSVGD